MLNFVSNEIIRKADLYTIENQGISSTQLMERAAHAFVKRFINLVGKTSKITIFCGKGNNGGDGLAIARLLHEKAYETISVYIVNAFEKESKDFTINKERLQNLKIPISKINHPNDFSTDLDVVIDAVLGSGFKGVFNPFFSEIFRKINQNSSYIVSVDVPSGLKIDQPELEFYEGIQAHFTISFQRPKLFFMFPESILFTKKFDFVDIGLDENYLQSFASQHFYIEEKAIVDRLKPKKSFSHKGTFGHLLLLAGSPKTMGAALLCAKSALFSGAGLVSACLEKEYFSVMNVFLPEIMCIEIEDLEKTTDHNYQAIATGPGLGKDVEAQKKLEWVLNNPYPTVFDADALNLIAEKNLLQKIPQKSIITPHLKEFDRLFGKHHNWQSRLKTAQQKAAELQCVIVLKNQYTFICDTDQNVYVNSTGNPSMAQGGMGDVLTGCVAAFLAQGYPPLDAALLACYVHGKAGDRLHLRYETTPASLIAEQISKTIKDLYAQKR